MKTACPYHTREVHSWESTGSFFAETRKKAVGVDLFFIIFVPLILLALHLYLPQRETRLAFALDYTNPALMTVYTAHFVHVHWVHLLSNIGAYLVIVPTAYVLSILTQRRRHFLWNFVLIFGLGPFVISGVLLFVNSHGIVLGFSGLVLAFYGYTSLIVVGYVASRLTTALHLDHAPLIFFTQIAVIMFIIPESTAHRSFAIGGSILFVAFYFVWTMWSLLNASKSLFNPERSHAGYIEFAVFAFLIGNFFLFQSFSGGQSGETGVAISGHIVGFVGGFILGYVLLRTGCALAHISHCAGPYGDCELHDSPLTRTLRGLILIIK
jgi:membrane associated rhomboid family serine protease